MSVSTLLTGLPGKDWSKLNIESVSTKSINLNNGTLCKWILIIHILQKNIFFIVNVNKLIKFKRFVYKILVLNNF